MSSLLLSVWAVPPRLTELSAAVVEGPSNSDHVGVRLAAGQVLYRNLLIDLKSGTWIRFKYLERTVEI